MVAHNLVLWARLKPRQSPTRSGSMATAIIATRHASQCTLAESPLASCYGSAKCHLATSEQTHLPPSIVLKNMRLWTRTS